RGVDELRLSARRAVRGLDAIHREKPVADADADRVAGGDLPVHVRHDRPEPAGVVPAGQGGSRLQRAGTGAQDQHAADPRDPPAHDRAAQAAYRPPQPAEEAAVAVGPGSTRRGPWIAANCPASRSSVLHRTGMPIGVRGSSYLTFASVLDAQAGSGEAMPS